MRRGTRTAVTASLVAGVFAGVFAGTLAAGASAGARAEEDVEARSGSHEARIRALEERVEALERKLGEREAEIARLRKELELRDGTAGPRFRVQPPRELLDKWRNQFDDMTGKWRDELEEWGMDWGLPGRERRPDFRPRELRPGRAFLGIEMEDAGGVAVRRVIPGSPAEKAGLVAGDVIAEIDGRAVAAAAEVVEIVGGRKPGETITVTVLRDGERLVLKATLARRGGRGSRAPDETGRFPRWDLGRGGGDRRPPWRAGRAKQRARPHCPRCQATLPRRPARAPRENASGRGAAGRLYGRRESQRGGRGDAPAFAPQPPERRRGGVLTPLPAGSGRRREGSKKGRCRLARRISRRHVG